MLEKIKSDKKKYYNISSLIKSYPNAQYYMVIGERSNGKTYSALERVLRLNCKTGEQFAYVRRYAEDIRPKYMNQLFAAHVGNGLVNELWNGQWDGITYVSGKFSLFHKDEEAREVVKSEEPIGFCFDLNSMEHYKSTSFPKITSIIFDEFMSRDYYLPNEFLLFSNMLSTIIRLRTNVKIFMLGNTVNRYCPYFSEMGLTHVKDQKQGTIDVYKYGDNDLEVVVEYCGRFDKGKGKASDVYFAFDNPQLQMITNGAWEIAIYPHLPIQYKPKEVVANFFIDFDGDLLHGQVVSPSEGGPFIFLHNKTTPIKNEENDIVYGQTPSHLRNHRIGFSRLTDNLSRFILKCIRENRVFYSTNEVGEIFRNYVMWSESMTFVNKTR